jgi:pimeloyl-ACP methyl ester carboxylesterase
VTEIADTELGPVQYTSTGEGRPVIVVHGTPGGYDQAELMARFLPRAEFRSIAPSRPGYLGSPLAGRLAVDQQADLLASLMDSLGIERAGILCWSGGGPSSYQLAAHHPDRVTAVIALAAATKPIQRPEDDLPTRLMFNTRAGEWLLRVTAAHAPKQLISATIDAEGALSKEQVEQRTNEVFADEVKRRFVLDLASTVTHRDREAGLENDWEQFQTMPHLDLEAIKAPCMLVQGGADSDVTPDHSEDAAARIPRAELITLDTGTHLAFYTHPDATTAQARAIELLRRGDAP